MRETAKKSFLLLTAVWLGGLGAAFGADPAPPPGPAAGEPDRFGDEITVSILPLTVRVVDALGRPVPGLTAADLKARCGRQEIPVVSVDWHAGSVVEGPSAIPPSVGAPPPVAAPAGEAARPSEGQLFAVFVQASLEPIRISGQLGLLPLLLPQLFDTLKPEDRVAVFSFDSHLKLWLDFTGDREAVRQAIARAVRTGGEPALRPNRRGLSAVSAFDRRAADDAASPEQALRVLAQTLANLPGEKAVIFLGYGLGRYGAGGVTMTPDYYPAVRALRAARATVFSVDITQAGYHSLAIGMESVAAATGGTYASTAMFPSQALRNLAGTLTGYYVVTLDASHAPERGASLTLELRDKEGEVLMAPWRCRAQ